MVRHRYEQASRPRSVAPGRRTGGLSGTGRQRRQLRRAVRPPRLLQRVVRRSSSLFENFPTRPDESTACSPHTELSRRLPAFVTHYSLQARCPLLRVSPSGWFGEARGRCGVGLSAAACPLTCRLENADVRKREVVCLVWLRCQTAERTSSPAGGAGEPLRLWRRDAPPPASAGDQSRQATLPPSSTCLNRANQ